MKQIRVLFLVIRCNFRGFVGIMQNERKSKAKDVKIIGESELPRAASSGCHYSTAKREDE